MTQLGRVRYEQSLSAKSQQAVKMERKNYWAFGLC